MKLSHSIERSYTIVPITEGERLELGTLVKIIGHDDTLGCIVESTEDVHGLTFKVIWAAHDITFTISQLVKIQPMTAPQGQIFHIEYEYLSGST